MFIISFILQLQEISFQSILATDGIYSYSIFTYNCSRTEWDGSVTVGFNAAGSFYDNHDPSSSDIACLNSPYSNISNVIYLLSEQSPELAPPGKFNTLGYLFSPISFHCLSNYRGH